MNGITLDKTAQEFVNQVEELSHSNLSQCWHCLCCSGGCPFSKDMDVLPNSIIRMIQFGMKEQALNSSTIWLCVGCNTCSMECPNAVDMAAIMDALRQMAIRKNAKIAEPGVLAFHNAVVDSISRYGRTHKLEIMMRYKFSEKDLFSDIDLGLKMLSKRKLDLLPSKVKDKKSIQSLFKMSGEVS
ncbi:MAG: 4Fe-4S dicluster domain-containing protein [Proteobacteria bacterium]|nr:4Fe-4S dicluster domain-containing protein [Pseudomonadota bacterium]MBU1542420.1 4Fe-4S dicluster domain-containing protein [Pseudomonadota bacterium]MBU2430091.1 4Fe-4S dicluster domain-containing protein [Pseudomonadota bacterium]MBU2482796.1 4Fe-4S dicluster domain-containing protein [Pseudomonadota bacterium]